MNDALGGDAAASFGPVGFHAWSALACFLIVYFIIDVFLLYRNPSSSKWSVFFFCFWLIADGVAGYMFYNYYGGTVAGNYADGLLLEGLFSIDNLALFFFVFQAFGTPAELYGKVLSCGMILACPLRLLFYFVEFGALRATWVVVVTGCLLILSGLWGLLGSGRGEVAEWNAEKKPILRLLIRSGRLWPFYDNRGYFFVKARPLKTYPATADPIVDPATVMRPTDEEAVPLRQQSRDTAGRKRSPVHLQWQATLLLLALMCIEAVDVVFAMDSTMANVAVSSNVFICYISSIFALFTMRSLFASLATVLNTLWLMRYILALLLIGIGVKVAVDPWHPIPQEKFLWFLVSLETPIVWQSTYMVAGLLLSLVGFLLNPPAASAPISIPPVHSDSRIVTSPVDEEATLERTAPF